MEKYLENYKSNNICCIAAFLTLGFSNSTFWVNKYVSGSHDKQAQSNYACEKIADQMTEYIIPYLNITVTGPSPIDDIEAGDTLHNSGEPHLGQNMYVQTEPKRGVDYDMPGSKDEFLIECTDETPDPSTLKPYLKERLYNELVAYRDFSYKVKHECQIEYWSSQNAFNGSTQLQKSSSTTTSKSVVIPKPNFKNYGNSIIGADKIFWKTYGVKFPILSLMNRICNNVPTTSVHAERFFSLASRVYTKNNARLSEESFRNRSFLKAFSLNINIAEVHLTTAPLKDALELTKRLNQRPVVVWKYMKSSFQQ